MLGGLATMTAGIVQAHTGFSDAAMAVSMPSSLVLLLWAFLAGIYLLRRTVSYCQMLCMEASGGDLILPDSVNEFHISDDFTQAAVAL